MGPMSVAQKFFYKQNAPPLTLLVCSVCTCVNDTYLQSAAANAMKIFILCPQNITRNWIW